jgi:hypothetical protein
LQNSDREPQPNIAIDWQRVCQEMLHQQQEEQRFRRRATEMGFEVNVFVPLGLIERKQQQRRSGMCHGTVASIRTGSRYPNLRA